MRGFPVQGGVLHTVTVAASDLWTRFVGDPLASANGSASSAHARGLSRLMSSERSGTAAPQRSNSRRGCLQLNGGTLVARASSV